MIHALAVYNLQVEAIVVSLFRADDSTQEVIVHRKGS